MTVPNKPLVAGTLLVSVVLNLFLVGVLAGIVPVAKHKHFGPMALATTHGDYMGEWLARYLAPADADAFRAALQPHADALGQAHAHVRQAVKDVAAVFEQNPPDPAALQSAFDRLKQAKAEVNDVVGAIVRDSYAKLSPEGRHRLADMTK